MPHLLRIALLSTCAIGCVTGPVSDPAGGQGDAEVEPSRRGLLPLDGKADGQCGPFPAWYHRHLDDTDCIKRVPTDRDRAFSCPNVADSAEAIRFDTGQSVTYSPADSPAAVDPTGLAGVVPGDVRMAAIVVRRVDGVPHYRYLGNGRQDDVVQPWSSASSTRPCPTRDSGAGDRSRRSQHLRRSSIPSWLCGLLERPRVADAAGANRHPHPTQEPQGR